jgi:hypothetical protein
VNPPLALGSGKAGTPWARMHWAYLSCSTATSAASPGETFVANPTAYFWQARSATWNVGELGLKLSPS